jgi:hypothetical protein
MTGKADFTAEEWELVSEGPTGAGSVVITASRGGTFRETFSMAKAYTEARKEHGSSELLDEIVSAKPEVDRSRHASPEELRSASLDRLGKAVTLLEEKASPEEVEDYRRFVVTLANRVAEAHKEHGERVSDDEQRAIEEIRAALGATGA